MNSPTPLFAMPGGGELLILALVTGLIILQSKFPQFIDGIREGVKNIRENKQQVQQNSKDNE